MRVGQFRELFGHVFAFWSIQSWHDFQPFSIPQHVLKNLIPAENILFENAVKISSGVVCLRLLFQFFIGVFQANKAYGIINILSTIYTASNILLTLYVAYTSKNIVLIQKLQLLMAMIMFIIYFAFCLYSGYLSKNSFKKPVANNFIEISKYGIRMWIAALGTTLFAQFDRLIILRLLGAEWAGIYSAITSVANQINVVSSMPVQPLLPTLTEYFHIPVSDKHIENLLIKSFSINAAIILLTGSCIIFFSPQLISILFDDKLMIISSIKTCLIVVTIAYSIYSFNAVGYFALLAMRNEKYVTNLVLVSGVFSIILIYALSIRFGIVGACVGNLGYSLTLLLNRKAINKLNIDRYILFRPVIYSIGVTLIFTCLSVLLNNFYLNFALYLLLAGVILFLIKDKFKFQNIFLKRSLKHN